MRRTDQLRERAREALSRRGCSVQVDADELLDLLDRLDVLETRAYLVAQAHVEGVAAIVAALEGGGAPLEVAAALRMASADPAPPFVEALARETRRQVSGDASATARLR
jgi:hypothetical protein